MSKRICVILARGGSKRLPRKNVLPFLGKPLIAWSIKAALDSGVFTEVVVSSDDSEILAVAKEHGAVTHIRPDELSSDTATSMSALIDCVQARGNFDTTVLLQPTSPIRTGQNIKEAIELFDNLHIERVISAVPTKDSPYYTIVEMVGDKVVQSKPSSATRSQDLPKCFTINGSIYVYDTKRLLETGGKFGFDNTQLYIMPDHTHSDIDTKLDFIVAESIAKEYLIKN
jgi:CMP-N,N'-diacetyllegionaminic acid synthase